MRVRKVGAYKFTTAMQLTNAYARLGNMEKAKVELETVRKFWPWMSVAFLRVSHTHYRNKRLLEDYFEAYLKAGMPVWPYGFKGSAEHRLRNTELQALYRGRPTKEFVTSPFGNRYQVLHDGKGNYTSKTAGGLAVGTLVIERDMVCYRSNVTVMGRKYCGEVYRNPKGSPKTNDAYVRINLWGLWKFSFNPPEKKSVDALAGKKILTGVEIRAAYSGVKMSQTNSYGTFITVWKADGTMTGKEKSGAVPDDEGKWWVKRDRLCRKWEFWAGGKEECFGVTLDGDKVKWWQADGSDRYPNSSITLTK